MLFNLCQVTQYCSSKNNANCLVIYLNVKERELNIIYFQNICCKQEKSGIANLRLHNLRNKFKSGVSVILFSFCNLYISQLSNIHWQGPYIIVHTNERFILPAVAAKMQISARRMLFALLSTMVEKMTKVCATIV